MLKLSQRDIRQGYKGIKALAKQDVQKRDYLSALNRIRHCTTLAQQFNWIYSDDEIELLLETIANNDLEATTYNPVPNRIVFFDDFCVSFILAIQYLDALKNANYEILYISTQNKEPSIYGLINDRVRTCGNVKMFIVTASNDIEAMVQIQQQIVKFAPSKIILHCKAYTLIAPVLYTLPKDVKSYLINLADQTFWLGARAVDYILEFRQFGVSVSQQRRSIKPEQQLLVPFYPVIDNNPFQGFSKECTEDGKVLIFSGSDIYKVLDEKRMYWHLVKRILDTFPEVVFLFATKGDEIGMDFLQRFIKDNHYEGRFIYTKFRPDINEVLAHTDIYLGTCPASGSLMSQLAARNATPILQYYYPGTPDDETEQAICVNEEFQISFQDEDEFMQEAEKLIHDKDYRKKQGERLQRAMISISQFNQLVAKTLETNQTQIALTPYPINYKLLDDRWFALEKAGFINSMNYMYGLLGAKECFRHAPSLWIKKNINKIIRKLYSLTSYN